MRAQGGKGLLSHKISLQKTQQFIPKTLEKEREEHEREKGGEGALAVAPIFCCVASQRTRERGEVHALLLPGGRTNHSLLPPLSFPPSLPLKTRIPLSAKIKLEGP